MCQGRTLIETGGNSGSYVNNLSSHKRAAVQEKIEEAGATLRFLPPYSPDFDPTEKAFSRLKAMLRKAGDRTFSGCGT